MVSDVLADAIAEIDKYLADDRYGESGNDLRLWIERVRGEMDALRAWLDTPPDLAPPIPTA